MWPGESVNGKVHENITTGMDEKYLDLLEERDMTYMAPVSDFIINCLPADNVQVSPWCEPEAEIPKDDTDD